MNEESALPNHEWACDSLRQRQGCSKVGPGHSKPETRRPRSELIATLAEQPPIELGHARNSDFPTNHTNDTNGKAPPQFVLIRVIRGQPFNFYDY